MAVDDNTNYELSGAQIKDLASRVKRNTTLAKNLAGGADKTNKLVYMTAINGTDAMRIAEEIDPEQASATMVTSLMKYRFYNAETGEEYDDLGDIMDVIDTEYGLIEFVQTPSGNSNYPVVKMVESAAVRADGEDYYLDIVLKTFDKASLTIGQENVTIGADTQFNLYWYKTTSTESILTRARGYVQKVQLYANDIVAEINASLPPDTPVEEYASWAQLTGFMEYVFFSESGTMLKTPADIRSLLRSGNNRARGPLVYIPTSGYYDNNSSISFFGWNGNASTGQGFIEIFSPNDANRKSFYIKAVDPTQYDDGRKHCWYECQYDDSEGKTNFSYGYTDPTFFDISTEAPADLFQVATDSSNNLYMAAGTSSTADWKRIDINTSVSDINSTDWNGLWQ